MDKIDYKKTEKQYYLPKAPTILPIPEMAFIAVDGAGDPNTSPAYAEAMEILYGLSFTIKMSKMSGEQPAGYIDYVVPPLEGLWWTAAPNFDGKPQENKDAFFWTSLIRQPDFVTEEIFQWAKEKLARKKPALNLQKARYLRWEEGLCAQVLHIGPYDAETETIDKLSDFITKEGYTPDISDTRRHHEIYLSDPRRTQPEKLKTVIRHPVKKR